MHFTGQIFTLDPAVVKTQTLFSSYECFLTCAMQHHRETIKSKHTMMKLNLLKNEKVFLTSP